MNRLRVPITPHKTIGPTLQLQYLGIILDTDKMEAILPEDKLSRIIRILDLLESKHIISKKELLSLLGHLNFASRVIPQGRSFVSYLLSLATTVKALHHHVRLDKECRLDIAMWRRFDECHFYGMSIAARLRQMPDFERAIARRDIEMAMFNAQCSISNIVTVADDGIVNL